MGQCAIMTNTYPGIDPDECTAKREHILTGYKAGVSGEEDPVAGTMHHLTNESTIQHESGNATKVIKADERFIGNNTDGVRRMSLRYNGTPGYIAGNTLVGLPAQTKTITPSTSQQTIGPDGGKLLENVVVNAIPNNRGVGAHGVSSGVNAQGLYYYIPSGWYPADNSGNSWVYRTLPEVANTIGLTAGKIKRGVTVGGVAGTCDWAVSIKSVKVCEASVNLTASSLHNVAKGSYGGTISTTGPIYPEYPYLVVDVIIDCGDYTFYSYIRPLGKGGASQTFFSGSDKPGNTNSYAFICGIIFRESDGSLDIRLASTLSGAHLIKVYVEGATNADING